MIKYKIFHKLLIMLAVLLVPATLLFAYANQTSETVVKETLENSASKQLEFTMQQLEQSLRQLEIQTLMLVNDSSIKAYASSWEFPEYVNHLLMRKNVEEKLMLQSQVDSLIHELTVYWPASEEVISTSDKADFNREQLSNTPKNRWLVSNEQGQLTFHLYFTNPSITKPDLSNVVSIVETAFTSDYLQSVLEGLDSSGNGNSFFYFPGGALIANNEVNGNMIPLLEKKNVFKDTSSTAPQLSVLEMDGVEYLIQTIRSPSLDGILVSYIKINEFLNPLNNVNLLVNGSLILLFISGVAISYLLYRHFRIPFGYLVRKIENLGAGDYTSRATVRTNNEFDYLFERFNDMASRIQALIENVYEERVRTKEAEYKHLQSQINPHFLYNCLFYIVSMANKSPEAVISMAKNLSQFYRHITRKAGTDTTLADEIRLIESYLEVQSMRNKRLRYEIDIPAPMLEMSVPTLLLQPLVENAVVHGIEQKRESGRIRIIGVKVNNQLRITVDDDGTGLSSEALQALMNQVHNRQSADETGCGLSNIHHRLIHRFGPESGLSFSTNEWKGFRVTLQLSYRTQEESVT